MPDPLSPNGFKISQPDTNRDLQLQNSRSNSGSWWSVVTKTTNRDVRQTCFQTQLLSFLAVQPWASYFASLSLHSSFREWGGWKCLPHWVTMRIQLVSAWKSLVKCRVHSKCPLNSTCNYCSSDWRWVKEGERLASSSFAGRVPMEEGGWMRTQETRGKGRQERAHGC